MIRVISWTGAAALSAAPFFIDSTGGKMLAIIGLTLLSVQAYRLKAGNLLALNAVGIVGYLHAIYF